MSESSEDNGKRKGRRWARWVLLLLLLGSAGASFHYWSERVALAEKQIRTALQQAGLTAFDISVAAVGLREARVRSFSVGEAAQPSLLVQDIRVHYTIAGLLEQSIGAIEIGSVSLSLKGDENGLDLSQLAPLMGGDGANGGGFGTGPISVRDLSARIDLPQGTLALETGAVIEQQGKVYRIALVDGCAKVDVSDIAFSGVVIDAFSTNVCATSEDGVVYWPPASGIALRTDAVPLIVRSGLGDTLLEAQFAETQADMHLGEEVGLRLRTNAAEVISPGQALSLDDADIEVAFDDLISLAGKWRLTSGRVRDLAPVRRFEALRVAGDGTVSADRATFDLLVSDLASLTLLASVDGTHGYSEGRGQADIVLGPVIFSATGLQPQTMFPAFKGLVANVIGSTNATANIEWTPGRLTGRADVRLDDLGFTTEAARIEGVRGGLVFDNLFPPKTAPGQRLEVGSVDAGVVLTDGAIAFSLDGAGGVTVENATWPFAGGSITLSSGVIEPGASEQAFELAVEKVDLSAFISLLALDGASGTGVISGRIPITIRDGDPIITGGVLVASEPGQLSYKGGGTDAIGGGQGAIVFQALEDFQYTGLTLTLDGNAQDRLNVKLNLEGANPGLYDGYPFAININTEASFAELLRSATLGANAIDLIRDRGTSGQ